MMPGFDLMLTNAALREARYSNNLYNELSEELRKHKVIAKEKKLARELQTERNLIAELSGHVR